MQIPQVQGYVNAQDFVVYTACDHDYFNQFGKIFCRSVQQVGQAPVHVHLFNPDNDQLKWCNDNNIGATWEHTSELNFAPAVERLTRTGGEPLRRSQVAISKGGDSNLQQRLEKTYYACVRFIRLAQMPGTVFACDIDAVVRKAIPRLSIDKDFYIHQIFGPKARFLAGGLYLNPNARDFVQAYANVLESKIQQDILYWSLDQDVLDPLVPRFNYGQLPESLIDWNMRPESVIWTAKGARKNNNSFVNEQQKYVV